LSSRGVRFLREATDRALGTSQRRSSLWHSGGSLRKRLVCSGDGAELLPEILNSCDFRCLGAANLISTGEGLLGVKPLQVPILTVGVNEDHPKRRLGMAQLSKGAGQVLLDEEGLAAAGATGDGQVIGQHLLVFEGNR